MEAFGIALTTKLIASIRILHSVHPLERCTCVVCSVMAGSSEDFIDLTQSE